MSTNPLETKQTYQDYVDKKSPNSPLLKNCFRAKTTARILRLRAQNRSFSGFCKPEQWFFNSLFYFEARPFSVLGKGSVF